jgi:hypothetical protein
MDLVATKGGLMAPVLARLLHGKGWDANAKLIRNVAFGHPWIHTLDHCTVVVLLLRRRFGQMKQYHQ